EVSEEKEDSVMAKARARASSQPALPKVIEENLDRLADTLSSLQRDAEKLQKQLIRRGKKAEREGRKQVNKLLRDIQKNGVSSRLKKARKQVEKTVDDSVTQVFRVLNLPERKDVEALNRKVRSLEKQIGTLRRSRRRATTRSSRASA
ncbi:MAG: phasin family protein, partial [Myxococcota bacterium]